MKTYWKSGDDIYLSEGYAEGALGRIFKAAWIAEYDQLPDDSLQMRPGKSPMEVMIEAWCAANEDHGFMTPLSSLELAILTQKLLDAGCVFKGAVDE